MSLKRAILKQQRIDAILESLKRLDYLSTSQILFLHDLKSTRNTSRVLTDMSEYLHHFRDGENIYYLSKAGRERCGATVVRKRLATAQHYIMRNQLYIYLGEPPTWKNEKEVVIETHDKTVRLKCDARYEAGAITCFIEVDHTQKMHKNADKIERYKTLQQHGKNLMLIWITTSSAKKKKLKELCKDAGLDYKVVSFTDIV